MGQYKDSLYALEGEKDNFPMLLHPACFICGPNDDIGLVRQNPLHIVLLS